VCITKNQPDIKSNPSPNPNPNSTTKHHAVVSIQLNIVTCPTYSEKFIKDSVIAPNLLLLRLSLSLWIPENKRGKLVRLRNDLNLCRGSGRLQNYSTHSFTPHHFPGIRAPKSTLGACVEAAFRDSSFIVVYADNKGASCSVCEPPLPGNADFMLDCTRPCANDGVHRD